MKHLCFFFFLLISFSASSQIVAGLYRGTLVNDSTGSVQKYELALSEYRGKITGYAYTTFVRNDTFYYSIKRVKGTRFENEIRIEDAGMISNNFPVKPDKGVRQINHIIPTSEDTLRIMNGSWETTEGKYVGRTFHGKSAMQRTPDSIGSPLIGHLRELRVIHTPQYAEQAAPVYASTPATKPPAKKSADTKPPKSNNTVSKPEIAKAEITTAAPKPQPETVAVVPKTWRDRAEIVLQPLVATGDSLTISFFDNGVIDNDTISVYINDVAVIQSARLTAVALRKTISIKEYTELRIVLVAENLGSIPPNTGLIQVRDGSKSYQLNFRADLSTNASLLITRKPSDGRTN